MPEKDFCLFALNGYRDFGLALAHCLGLDLAPWDEQEFADGEHRTSPRVSVRGRHVVVMQSLRANRAESVDDKLCRLLFFIGAMKDGGAAQVTAVVPYLCYARQDRRDAPGDPLTHRYVAQLLESMGTDRLLTLDVHNPAAFQNAYGHGAEHLEATGLFVEHLVGACREFRLGGESITVLAPDSGGIKRARRFREALARRLEHPISDAYLDKQRDSAGVTSSAVIGPVYGKTVIIVDDMITTGRTIVSAARTCRRQGAVRVWAMASHGVFVAGAETCLHSGILDQLIVTNSVPLSPAVTDTLGKRLTVLDCAPLFADALSGTGTGTNDAVLPAVLCPG